MPYGKTSYEDLHNLTREILVSMGYPEDRAEITSTTLVEADARGVSSHGVSRLKVYEDQLKKGYAKPQNDPEIVFETPLSIVIDGHQGIGPYISEFAMKKCIEKTAATGACYVAVRNSNHYGMAGLWAEMAAKHGYIGMSFTNTIRCAVPVLSVDRKLGSNPIAVAIPSEEGKDPFLLDMGTTTVTRGKLRVYDRRNRTMPSGWFVDEEGKTINDPHKAVEVLASDSGERGGNVFLGGETEDLGGHKGYGLGLFVELFCAPLSMGAWTYDVFQTQEATVCHFFSAFRLDLFGDEAPIRKYVGDILTSLQNSTPSEGNDRVYTPGQKEYMQRALSMREGVELDIPTCEMLDSYAHAFGLDSIF